MTARSTTQAAAELTEDDGSSVLSGLQFDSLAKASNRTPRLVATTDEDISVEPSGKAPSPATKRSRPAPAPKRTKATKTTKAKDKQEAPSAPVTVSAAPTVPEAVPPFRHPGTRQRRLCPCCSSRPGNGCGIFSVTGMAEIFPALRLPSWCSPPRWKPENS